MRVVVVCSPRLDNPMHLTTGHVEATILSGPPG